jgi:hypothetical protein
MGQQQLILLVLATIIVGLAIVVGIRAFNENSLKSNADAMVQDAVRIANDLQAWKQKPAPFGGQASVTTAAVVLDRGDFTGATFPLLGYALGTNGCTTAQYGNLNGCFTLAPATAQTEITGTNAQHANDIRVIACGLSDEEVVGYVVQLGGVATGVTAPTCTTTTPAAP